MTTLHQETAFMRNPDSWGVWKCPIFPSIDVNVPEDEAKRYSDKGYHVDFLYGDWDSDDHKDGLSYRFHWTFMFGFSNPSAPIPADFEFQALYYLLSTIREAYSHGYVEFAGFNRDEPLNQVTLPSEVKYADFYSERNIGHMLNDGGLAPKESIPAWIDGHVKLKGDPKRGPRSARWIRSGIKVPGLAKPIRYFWAFKAEIVLMLPVHPDDIKNRLKKIVDDLCEGTPGTLHCDSQVVDHKLTPVYGVPYNPAASRILSKEKSDLRAQFHFIEIDSDERFNYFSWCVEEYLQYAYRDFQQYLPVINMPVDGNRLEMPRNLIGKQPVLRLLELSDIARDKGKFPQSRNFFDMAVDLCARTKVLRDEYWYVDSMHMQLDFVCENSSVLERMANELKYKEQAEKDIQFIRPFQTGRRKGIRNKDDEWVYYERIDSAVRRSIGDIRDRIRAYTEEKEKEADDARAHAAASAAAAALRGGGAYAPDHDEMMG